MITVTFVARKLKCTLNPTRTQKRDNNTQRIFRNSCWTPKFPNWSQRSTYVIIVSRHTRAFMQCHANAGINVSKTTVQVNETDMEERRQKLLSLNKIRGFDESHPISVSGDARYNNPLESGVGKAPFRPATQNVYCISENETPNKGIISVNIDNMLCDTAQLMRAQGRDV